MTQHARNDDPFNNLKRAFICKQLLIKVKLDGISRLGDFLEGEAEEAVSLLASSSLLSLEAAAFLERVFFLVEAAAKAMMTLMGRQERGRATSMMILQEQLK